MDANYSDAVLAKASELEATYATSEGWNLGSPALVWRRPSAPGLCTITSWRVISPSETTIETTLPLAQGGGFATVRP
jgi:hypothetical protein